MVVRHGQHIAPISGNIISSICEVSRQFVQSNRGTRFLMSKSLLVGCLHPKHAHKISAALVWSPHSYADSRPSSTIFYRQLKQGTESHGGQYELYKDTMKSSLKAFQVNPSIWEATAQDRARWQQICPVAINSFEARHTSNTLCKKHELHKAKIQQSAMVMHSLSVPQAVMVVVLALVSSPIYVFINSVF